VAVFPERKIDASFVVAADGIHSTVRSQLCPNEGPPLWNGSLMWRGIVEADPLLDGRTMIWAGHPDQKFVAYPISEAGSGCQMLNFIAELRRPRSTLGTGEEWERLGELDDFLPSFESWTFEWLDVPSVVRSAPQTFLFPMVDRDPLPRWTFGRTTLLGDAAHPMYPIGSNGASQAILDARVLAGCLRRTPEDVDLALENYEATRRPATAAIVQANRGMGPELPMKLVHERAPEGFSDISDVISPEEIQSATEDYRRTAGFALAALSSGRSLLDDPFPR
jgi:2-polyprenyl-6-methoxyphenol hydroxylase-like FAD-dependent oxidoreductase